jgi:FkbM family methyltransferase
MRLSVPSPPMNSSRRDRVLACVAAEPSLDLSPGWFVGAGQSIDARTRFRKSVWRALRAPVQIKWFDDLRLLLYPRNEISKSIFVTGRYEPNEFRLLSRILSAGMTFIDVGANMGLYTIFAAHRVQPTGRVISIEPSAREQELLLQNIGLNRFGNVAVLPAAVADRSGTVELLVAPFERSGHNTLGRFGYDTKLDHSETVRTITLDSLLDSEGLDRVDVIKIDIEGGELSALRGAAQMLSAHHPALLLELSDRALVHQHATSGEILSYLASCGYQTYVFDRGSGLPVPLQPRAHFDSENIVAFPIGAPLSIGLASRG